MTPAEIRATLARCLSETANANNTATMLISTLELINAEGISPEVRQHMGQALDQLHDAQLSLLGVLSDIAPALIKL